MQNLHISSTSYLSEHRCKTIDYDTIEWLYLSKESVHGILNSELN